jgi:hypothetical protein
MDLERAEARGLRQLKSAGHDRRRPVDNVTFRFTLLAKSVYLPL